MEVTKKNFEELFPIIIESIQEAHFMSIDAEFTGLRVSDYQKPNLFDDGAERYKKLKKCASQFIITQIGLCTFTKQEDKSVYEARSYNFYLFPRAVGCLDKTFMCQSSCLEFLMKHKFDFNKFVYEGLSFVNEEQEKEINKMVESQDIFLGSDRDMDNESLQSLCSYIAKWLVSAKDGEQLQVEELPELNNYLLHWEVRARFPQVWTEDRVDEEGDEQFVVIKVTAEQRMLVETETKQKQGEKLKNEVLGFTRVFRAIVNSKKLILGHNNLTDLLLMHEHFYKPLPASYKEFKENISVMFPLICDTKHLAANLRRQFEESGLLQSTCLSDLYKSLSSAKGRTYSLYSPDVKHAEGYDKYKLKHQPHEAGYDAYMCGCVFLRMAHLWTTNGIASTDARPVSFHQYVSKVKPYINSINMIRGAVDHVCLNSIDPESRRPQWLFVRSKKFSYILKSSELARLFSTYGSVDIKLQNSHKALVAVSNHTCAKNILKAFHSNKSISVTRYSIWKHSPTVRATLWGGLLLTSGICIWSFLSSLEIKHT